MPVQQTPGTSDAVPQRIAAGASRRLETLWLEAHHQLDRPDLGPDASSRWADALDNVTLALQALEDNGAPPSVGWGHRAWDERRPG